MFFICEKKDTAMKFRLMTIGVLLAFVGTGCATKATATDWQATSVTQQNTVIALLEHTPTSADPLPSAVATSSGQSMTATPTAAGPGATPLPTDTPGPAYLATIVAQNATMVARSDGASVPFQQTVIAQQATIISKSTHIDALLGTQTAQQASHIRLQQTANAVADFQAVQFHTVRDMAVAQVNQQATANALQATSITLARIQLQEQRDTDATAVAQQRGQTHLMQTQVALQATTESHASMTEYYTCLTARDTHPALTCTKPKK